MDPDSAEKGVDPRVADVLFVLTITNSVVNPYVYGSYASEMRNKCFKWFGLSSARGQGGLQGAVTAPQHQLGGVASGVLLEAQRRNDNSTRRTGELQPGVNRENSIGGVGETVAIVNGTFFLPILILVSTTF